MTAAGRYVMTLCGIMALFAAASYFRFEEAASGAVAVVLVIAWAVGVAMCVADRSRSRRQNTLEEET